MSDSTTAALTVVIVAAVIFMVCRAVVLWYWKVGEQISLLKEIRDSLRRLEPTPPPQARTLSAAEQATRKREMDVEAEVARLSR